DAGEVGLDHDLSRGLHGGGLHAPRGEDAHDLLAHPFGRHVAHRDHSALMLASRMTRAHFSESARIVAPNCSGESPTTAAESAVIFSRRAGSCSAFCTSAEIFASRSFGVAAGATRPNQLV